MRRVQKLHKKHLLDEVLLSITAFHVYTRSTAACLGSSASDTQQIQQKSHLHRFGARVGVYHLLNSAADNDGNRANFGNLGNLVKTSL